MEKRIQRAKLCDKIATAIFVAIAGLFFLLLFGFAGKVIIGGFLGAKPEMFRFAMNGAIGNQLFNTIYLVFISLLVSCPIGVFAGIYLAMYAKKGRLTKIIRICIETLSSLPSILIEPLLLLSVKHERQFHALFPSTFWMHTFQST